MSAESSQIDRQLVFTAPTANDAAVTFPEEVRADLRKVGLAHGKVAVTRVDSSGESATSIVDLTPEVDGHVYVVEERAVEVIDEKVSEIEQMINGSPATSGDRALYVGLTRVDFSSVPTYVVSSLLDTVDPVDFRSLNWGVSAEEILERVRGAQPVLGGPVTAVVVPVGGEQRQLGQEEKTYRNEIWRALLISAGATSVTFLEATGSAPVSPTAAPTIPVPDLPETPIAPISDPAVPGKLTCTVPDSYFDYGTAALLEPENTKGALAECVNQALVAGATFTLDGYASYEGPLTPEGKPSTDDPWNRTLSKNRVTTIETLLIDEFGVSPTSITKKTGHGNTDQPYPDDPRSEKNRVVIITYTLNQ